MGYSLELPQWCGSNDHLQSIFGRENKKSVVLFGFFSKRKEFNVLILFYPKLASRILKRICHIISICQIISFRTPVGLMGKNADF